METNRNIQNKIEDAFKAIDAIEKVKAPPFFKDKTMRRLFAEKEEQHEWFWLTPRLQLAALVCVIILNVFAFTQLRKDDLRTDDYHENISNFADAYGLSVEDGNSLMN